MSEEIKECAHCGRVQQSREMYMRVHKELYCIGCHRKIEHIMIWDIINPLKAQLWDLAERWLMEKENG